MAAAENLVEKGSWWQKSTIANVVAATVIVSAIGYAVYSGNSEMVKELALIGTGYLFGRSIK